MSLSSIESGGRLNSSFAIGRAGFALTKCGACVIQRHSAPRYPLLYWRPLYREKWHGRLIDSSMTTQRAPPTRALFPPPPTAETPPLTAKRTASVEVHRRVVRTPFAIALQMSRSLACLLALVSAQYRGEHRARHGAARRLTDAILDGARDRGRGPRVRSVVDQQRRTRPLDHIRPRAPQSTHNPLSKAA